MHWQPDRVPKINLDLRVGRKRSPSDLFREFHGVDCRAHSPGTVKLTASIITKHQRQMSRKLQEL